MAGLIALGIIIAVALLYLLVVWVLRTYRKQVTAGREGMEGETAVVKTALSPKGTVQVEGEIWQAVIDKGRAEPEEEVIIKKVEGLKLRVTRKE